MCISLPIQLCDRLFSRPSIPIVLCARQSQLPSLAKIAACIPDKPLAKPLVVQFSSSPVLKCIEWRKYGISGTLRSYPKSRKVTESPAKQQPNPQWDAEADRMLRSEKAVHISFMKLAIINLIAIISISTDIIHWVHRLAFLRQWASAGALKCTLSRVFSLMCC